MFVASTHSSRQYLRDVGMHVWTEYANHLLGSLVLGLLGGDDGTWVGRSEWEVILTYEQEVRREMINRMASGTPLDNALRGAWADPVVRDRFLVAPMQKITLAGKRVFGYEGGPGPKRVKQEPGSSSDRPKGSSKGEVKGKVKGKGKGKGSKGSQGQTECKDKTPQGNRICFAFNSRTDT